MDEESIKNIIEKLKNSKEFLVVVKDDNNDTFTICLTDLSNPIDFVEILDSLSDNIFNTFILSEYQTDALNDLLRQYKIGNNEN